MQSKRMLAAVLLLLFLVLCGFTPFTRVTNVCPQCPAAKTDVLVLTNGFRVTGAVVAQNVKFYVVERYGEYRPVFKSEVASVEWKDQGGPGNLGTGDQILLSTGVVLHGAIIIEKTGRYFEIQVGGLRHIVWNSQIRSVFKGGAAYSIPSTP